MLNFSWTMRALVPLVLLTFIPPLLGQSILEETTDVLERWVDMERRIAEAENEWEADKASMEGLIALYSQEIVTLEEQIKLAESDVSVAEAKRAELNEREDQIHEVEAVVASSIMDLEIMLKGLEMQLPPPLKDELSPLFNALPEDPADSKLSLGQRIQPIAAILTQIQKFNQAVTVIDDFREFEAGRTVQTQSIYFGLGAAYYVDQVNEHAGFGVVDEAGWSWVDQDDLALEVRSFLDVYGGKKQAEYVQLPVSVK